MAKQTFQNQGGHVHVQVDPGHGAGEGFEVEAGGTCTTDDEDVKTALRKSGFKVKSESRAESKASTYDYKKEND